MLQNNAEMIFCKDKTTDLSREISIVDVAVKKNIYTDKKLGNPLYWEDQYRKKETKAGLVLQKIIKGGRLNVISNGCRLFNDSDKKFMANFIMMQMLRTPRVMAYLGDCYQKNIPVISDYLQRVLGDYWNEHIAEKIYNISNEKDLAKNIQLQTIFDQYDNALIAGQLYSKNWVVYRIPNPSEKFCFYTSDNPVIISDVLGERYSVFESGIDNPFTIIHYPLSADLLLAIYGNFSKYERYDSKLFFLQENEMEFVSRINELQKRQCNKYVFSYYSFP